MSKKVWHLSLGRGLPQPCMEQRTISNQAHHEAIKLSRDQGITTDINQLGDRCNQIVENKSFHHIVNNCTMQNAYEAAKIASSLSKD